MPAGRGPAIRLVSAATDRLQRIVIEVDSLEAARKFLSAKQLLGAAQARGIAIDPAKIQRLSIHLVEK